MSAREWWRHFFAALGGRPIVEDEPGAHQCAAMMFWSGHPVETDEEKAGELLGALVHAHHEVCGTWPDPPRVRAALDALGVPTKGPADPGRALLDETGETTP